jgi:hypothetical protein
MASDSEIIRVAHLMFAVDSAACSEDEFQRALDPLSFRDMSAMWFAAKLIEGKPYRIETDSPEIIGRARSIAGLLGGSVSSVETDGDTTIVVFAPPGRQ